jgi:hypothetical protein
VIDFRYHLISIVGVLLALAIGILAGSGFLGGPLLSDLRHRLNNIAQDNSGLQKDVAALRRISQQNQVFAQATQPWLLQTALTSHSVVLLEPEGTDTSTSDGIVSAIVSAGGTVTSTVSFTDKFALTDPTARDELALSIQSTSGVANKLREEAASLLGLRAAAASRAPVVSGSKPSGSAERFEDLMDQLERDGFVSADRARDGITVDPGALFIVLAGSVERAPFPATSFSVTLARSLANHDGIVLAAEPSQSVWSFVSSVRADAEARSTVSTVDDADTVPGGIATVMGLREAMRGHVGHYGYAPGADSVIPEPSVSPS